MVWREVMSKKIIGPYFFKDKNGKTVSVNALNYHEMVQDFLIPEIEGERDMWFQQDRATSHTVRGTIT
uniref:DUF659 domain-containing protein n=1 Tax=Strongyloides stercoralis TaxID=6248 RepID=A0A0K0EGT0_STRER